MAIESDDVSNFRIIRVQNSQKSAINETTKGRYNFKSYNHVYLNIFDIFENKFRFHYSNVMHVMLKKIVWKRKLFSESTFLIAMTGSLCSTLFTSILID